MFFELFQECIFLLNKMSPYLLFGFIVAGIIHIFIKEDKVVSHLGTHSVGSVIKAALFGIPLPLCSCSVVPTALSLKRDGASKGSILSFLISTPTTGIDSIFATYSLLGGFFAVFRVIASFVAGVLAGILSIMFDDDKPLASPSATGTSKACCCHHGDESQEKESFLGKLSGALHYAFFDLMEEMGGWLVLGIVIGGIISYFVPESFVDKYLGSLWASIAVMMIVGIPMYVCSSGSLPIAAALMLKGLNPAAAFVFLFVGPATNSASLTLVLKELGIKSTIIFLLSIISTSVIFGIVLNFIWEYFDVNLLQHLGSHEEMIPYWIETCSSIILMIFVLFHFYRYICKAFSR